MNTQSIAAAKSPAFASSRRINQSLTASVEKRVLVWMAERARRSG